MSLVAVSDLREHAESGLGKPALGLGFSRSLAIPLAPWCLRTELWEAGDGRGSGCAQDCQAEAWRHRRLRGKEFLNLFVAVLSKENMRTEVGK